jgi:hypothetical protein
VSVVDRGALCKSGEAEAVSVGRGLGFGLLKTSQGYRAFAHEIGYWERALAEQVSSFSRSNWGLGESIQFRAPFRAASLKASCGRTG